MKARSLLAPVAGLVTGVLVVALLEALGHLVFPPPPGVDLSDPEALRTIMRTIPPGALVAVLLAWFAGVAVGVWVAVRVHPAHARWPGIVTAVGLAAAAAATMVSIPHPGWFIATAAAMYAVGALVGLKLAPAPQ